MGLASHLNVWNTCLRILVEKGYALRVSGEVVEEGTYPAECLWIAEKDDFYFCADNPIELLGLVAVRDHLQPKEDVDRWWRTNGPEPDLYGDLRERAFGDCKLGERSESTE